MNLKAFMKREIKLLDIFYGNKCNLACSQCDTRSDRIRKDTYDPDMDIIKESIYLAHKNFNVNIWSILGGEPMLYLNKIEEILSYLRSLEPDSTVMLATNGSLIDRNITRLADLIKKYNLYVQVCNHFVSFDNLSYSQKVIDQTNRLVKELKLETTEHSSIEWWNKVIDTTKGGEEWFEYMRRIGFNPSTVYSSDRSWIGDNYGIYYIESPNFKSITKFDVFGKPKPFDSSDPEASYWNSCPSGFCALLKDKKIYKCAALGTLETFLKSYNSLEDPAWKKYLNYKGLDLTTCTPDTIDRFMKNLYCHIDECSMCPKNNIAVKKTEENVLPRYKKLL